MLEELKIIEPVIELLRKKEIEWNVISDVVAELPIETADQAVEQARHYQPELVIGIGGGSALDLAKAVSVLLENPGEIHEYLNLNGEKVLKRQGVPKVLIPTTAGTGSEVTDISVFSLKDTKDVITHDYLLADYAIVDPLLTYTLPQKVTAASGIDALVHALEAYTSTQSTPLTDSLALEAIGKITANIRTAVWNGADREAREQMASGSLIAGLSFFNAGVAGVHALAYPLGGQFKIPHGESNAVLLPYVYDSIWLACLDKLVKVADVMGVPTKGKDRRTIAQDTVQALFYLVEDVGLPTKLIAYNIQRDDVESLTENALKQARLLKRSPKQLDEKSIKEIYYNAFQGTFTHNR